MLHFLTAVVCELAVDAVHKVKNEEGDGGGGGGTPVHPRREEITDTMIFGPNDLVTMICKDVDLNYATRDTFTDSAIGSRINGDHREKVLQRWDGGDSNGENFDLDTDTSNGWDASEMFRFNEETYGVKSTYDASLSMYTVPLERGSSEGFRQREARAARLASEIEASSQYRHRVALENDEGRTDEDKFSAVVRDRDRDGGERERGRDRKASTFLYPKGQGSEKWEFQEGVKEEQYPLCLIEQIDLAPQARHLDPSPLVVASPFLPLIGAALCLSEEDAPSQDPPLANPTYLDTSSVTMVTPEPTGPTPLFPVDVNEILSKERTESPVSPQEGKSAKVSSVPQRTQDIEDLRKFRNNFRVKPSATPTPPRPTPPSPTVVLPAPPGQAIYNTPYPQIYGSHIQIQGHSVQVCSVVTPRSDHSSSAPPMIQAAASAAGPPLVASPYPPSYLPYNQVYSMLQGGPRMLGSGGHPQTLGPPGPQYPGQTEGPPAPQQGMYAPQSFSHHSGSIHPPQPSSTPTGSQPPPQHPAPSPGQSGQSGPQPQSLYHSGPLSAPTPPNLPPGHSSPQASYSLQGYSLPGHQPLHHPYSSIGQLTQPHVPGALSGPHHSGGHGPPQVMLLHAAPPQQGSGPQHGAPPPQQPPHPHYAWQPHVQAHPSQSITFHTPGN
ncbi:ataxin-2 isoform X1 [Labeo rohita]|uniref:Ataxin-2 isoform X1 n=1 Tax=Labeo rohita TaxID=84645 RepID=A0A498P337_LABRO|nr:ataxin-2 isoform X1 [Labeo rohita]